MRFYLTVILAVASFAGSGPLLQAQSLGDIALKEAERRKSLGESEAKVYTNKDLGSRPLAAPRPPQVAAAEVPGDGDGAADQAETEPSEDPQEPAGARDQTYWAGRMKELQTVLQRNLTYVEALQSRINALTADFVNRDDPAQRAAIASDRERAMAELERLQTQVEDDRKAISDFQDGARRSGVPPGWLR
jgi:hypothetical protein